MFLEKVHLIPFTTCWVWSGARHKDGYGTFFTGKSSTRSHRYSYEMYKGKIPQGLTLDHLCRNPNCVNPNHLEPVTLKENIRRAPKQISNINRNKTNCPLMHEYDYNFRKKYGKCKICNSIAGAKYYRKRKKDDPNYKNSKIK